MMIVDQGLSARRLKERLDRTTDARHRQMLEVVIEHLRAEVEASVDALLATLVPEPDYHLWQDGSDYGPKGVAQVMAYYQELVDAKRQVLEFDITRIVVDDQTIVTEGWIRAINLGSVARARGYHVDDDDASYLVTQRVVIFWPFNEEGKMLGEDGYANLDAGSARLLSDEELPEVYRRLFAGVS
jgi:hypothetical protein